MPDFTRVLRHLHDHRSEVADSLSEKQRRVKCTYVSPENKDAARAAIDRDCPYLGQIDAAIEVLGKAGK